MILSKGIIYEANIKNFQKCISDDTELLSEFNSLDLSKKKQMLFHYLLKYNNNNPLTIINNL